MKLAGPSEDSSSSSSSLSLPPPSEEEHPIASDDSAAAAGTGRLYECVFCKRGFNTAQALGGHMNIHRKDGTRNRTLLHVTAAHRNPPSESTPPHHSHRLRYPENKRAAAAHPRDNHVSGNGGLDLELRLGYLHRVEDHQNNKFIHDSDK